MESVRPSPAPVGDRSGCVELAHVSPLMVGVANANATPPATMPAVAPFSPTAQVQRPGSPHAKPPRNHDTFPDGPRAGGSSPRA